MLIIEKQNIREWVKKLTQKTKVIAPVRRGKESIFEEFTDETEIDFDYLPTLRSIKEFFLPAKEEIFIVGKKGSKITTPLAPKSFIIFGLNTHDLEAVTQLDEIMAKPNPDFFYFQRRKAAMIIGLANEPVKIPAGGDLMLTKINEKQYEAIVLTEKGRSLAKNKFFKNEAAVVTNAGSKRLEIMPQLKQLLLDPELLADAVSWSWKHDPAIWDELANLCLGCGICTYVCPLCYCFSTEDKVALGGKIRSRCRNWDACTLPKFAQISGGFNFHKTIRERYYNWYYHKFVRAYKEYGKAQCVACGRCQKYCPAKIDIENYLAKIIENYKEAMNIA